MAVARHSWSGSELAPRAARETRDAFRLRFEITTLQRTLKALGTFGYMAAVRENRHRWTSAEPTTAPSDFDKSLLANPF